MSITLDRLQSFLQNCPRLTIGLIGDLFLDRYLELAPGAEELSLETGLEAYQIERVRNSPGALGTVMNNLAALGAGRLLPVTVLGNDGHGYDLRRSLRHLPVDDRWIVLDEDRLTPTYTKPMRPVGPGRWEELNRLDVRTRAPLSATTTGRVCAALREVWNQAAGLIVLDQVNECNAGVVNEEVRCCLAELAAADPDKLMFIDSRSQLCHFGFGVVKGNQHEILSAACREAAEPLEIGPAACALARRTHRPVFCTVGQDGILVAKPDGTVRCVPGYTVSGPIDIVGAGDAASSGIVVSLLSGGCEAEAAAVGNLVASITVQQLGSTGTASPMEVVQRWHDQYVPRQP
jgi:bifunctional ADP-heptose synthase (sugar kinase/adenylyltransferase)